MLSRHGSVALVTPFFIYECIQISGLLFIWASNYLDFQPSGPLDFWPLDFWTSGHLAFGLLVLRPVYDRYSIGNVIGLYIGILFYYILQKKSHYIYCLSVSVLSILVSADIKNVILVLADKKIEFIGLYQYRLI